MKYFRGTRKKMHPGTPGSPGEHRKICLRTTVEIFPWDTMELRGKDFHSVPRKDLCGVSRCSVVEESIFFTGTSKITVFRGDKI